MTLSLKVVGRAVQILHVEDNPGDATILKQVLKKAGFFHQLTSVNTGEAALDFLNRRKSFSSAIRPDVVLLDLGLPGKDGLTVLNELRQNTNLTDISVVVLTASESDLDMGWASRLNVERYIVKPFEPTGYAELVELLRGKWMKTFRKKIC
jgi:chemotaxis family two-component system response regulator Rcp1